MWLTSDEASNGARGGGAEKWAERGLEKNSRWLSRQGQVSISVGKLN